jgi:hypothetical protein
MNQLEADSIFKQTRNLKDYIINSLDAYKDQLGNTSSISATRYNHMAAAISGCKMLINACYKKHDLANRENIDLGKTKITDEVRVSSAAIWYDVLGGYYQYETWVFSEDKNFKSEHTIHGTSKDWDNDMESLTRHKHVEIADKSISLFKEKTKELLTPIKPTI